MKLCEFCEIVHNSPDCPLCQANEKINEVIRENEVLRERIDLAMPTAFHGEV